MYFVPHTLIKLGGVEPCTSLRNIHKQITALYTAINLSHNNFQTLITRIFKFKTLPVFQW